MKFRSIATPPESQGQKGFGPKKTVPDQALSLQEIIQRFVRGEKLPVDMGGEYYDLEVDLEKLRHMDLTEREEYMGELKERQDRYRRQEARKEQARRDKIRAEEREAIRKEELEKAANNTP